MDIGGSVEVDQLVCPCDIKKGVPVDDKRSYCEHCCLRPRRTHDWRQARTQFLPNSNPSEQSTDFKSRVVSCEGQAAPPPEKYHSPAPREGEQPQWLTPPTFPFHSPVLSGIVVEADFGFIRRSGFDCVEACRTLLRQYHSSRQNWK